MTEPDLYYITYRHVHPSTSVIENDAIYCQVINKPPLVWIHEENKESRRLGDTLLYFLIWWKKLEGDERLGAENFIVD